MLKLGMKHPESVADHSYRVAVMGMVYSDLRGLDTEKVLRMAILHDLAEALVGDITPGERTATEKRRMEERAMKEILGDLAAGLAKKYGAIWDEYEERRSPEAKLVGELDKAEMALQASDYRRRDPALDVEEFVLSAKRRVADPELVALIEAVKT